MAELTIPYEKREDKPLSDQELVEKCELQYKAADRKRRDYEPLVFDNCVFVFGDQKTRAIYSDIQRHTTRNFSGSKIDTKINAVSNQIYPMWRQMQATAVTQISGNRAIARPGTQANPSDLRLINDFLRMRSDEIPEQKRRLYEFQESSLGGRVLRWSHWNPRIGRGGEGEIDVRTMNFWEFLLPHTHLASEWLMQPPAWIIIPTVRDVGEIKDLFGVEVEPEDNANADRMLERVRLMVTQGNSWQQPSTAERKWSATLKEMIVPPNAKYPKGRYIIWCGKHLLRNGDLPDQIVPTAIDFLPIPRYIPMTAMEMCIGLQTQYNNIVSMMLEMSQRQLRVDTIQSGGVKPPKVAYDGPNGTGARRIILPDGVKDWKQLTYDFNPLNSIKMMEVCLSDMKANFGTSDPSLGVPLEGKRTKYEIQTMTASDGNGMQLLKQVRDWAYADIGLDEWKLAYANYKTPRELRLSSERDSGQATEFLGCDLGEPTQVVPRTMPILTLQDQLRVRQQLRADGAFGPYEGNPEKELQGREAILDSGLPDAEDLAGKGSMPIEELRDLVYGQLRNEYTMQQIASEQRLQQIQAPEPPPQPQGVLPGQQVPQQALPAPEGVVPQQIPQEQVAYQ